MSSYTHLYSVRLGARHHPTGRTVHRVGSETLPAPSSLAIAAYPGEEGCYLLYLAADGSEMTATLHDSPETAMAQAEWEFGVLPTEWQPLGWTPTGRVSFSAVV